MKKFFIVCLSVILAVAIAGCSSESVSPPSTTAPWRVSDTNRRNTEISVYKVVKRDKRVADTGSDEGGIVGEGYLIYTLAAVADDSPHAHVPGENESKQNRDILTAEMYIEYNEHADAVLRGKTDRIVGEVVFHASSYTPYYSKRVVTYERGADIDGNAYYNDSYTVETDYVNKTTKTVYKERYREDENQPYQLRDVEESLDFSDAKAAATGQMIDNELLYMYVRALDVRLQVTPSDTENCMSGFSGLFSCFGGETNTPEGGTGTLKLCNPIDMIEDKKFFTYAMGFTCATDKDGYSLIEVGDKLNSYGAENGKLASVKTTLSVTSGRSGNGNGLTAYYAGTRLTNPILPSAYTEKVLVRIQFTENMRYTETGAYSEMDLENACTTTQTLCDFYYGTNPGTFNLAPYQK